MSRPNVVLIVMDTARARTVLGRPDVMPNLHRIADEGVTFENAFTTGPWTLPSHASMFTGQYTSDHGTHAGSRRFDPDVPTLAELLQGAGYRTVGISNNTWVSPDFGFDCGFDTFDVAWELVDGGVDLPTIAKSNEGTTAQITAVCRNLLDSEAPKTILNAAFSKLLRRRFDDGALVTNWRIRRRLSNGRAHRPFFMFVNYLEPHLEYSPPDRFRPDWLDASDVEDVNQDAWAYICGSEEMDERDFEALTSLYEGELAYLDYRIGQVYDFLDERDLLDETALFVVGDHGENIGEHGLMDHQYCLYDTLLHVPLVARYPSEYDGGEHREELFEVRDLYPTILDLAGVDVPADDGVSTTRLGDGEGREYVLGEYLTPQPSMEALAERVDDVPDEVRRYDRGLRSIRTREWKYIQATDGTDELYDVRVDPLETDDVVSANDDVRDDLAARLESDLGEFEQSSDDHGGEIDGATERRLEDLGYLQ
ncbi:sulfatase [Haloarchaeobius sp. HRN-SO-5]|uniref:sulfatase n=1 Tax=Haloarchaeobius sp. HRN-SO-5 TaxID=3446118 RepID=UPI003EBC11FB